MFKCRCYIFCIHVHVFRARKRKKRFGKSTVSSDSQCITQIAHIRLTTIRPNCMLAQHHFVRWQDVNSNVDPTTLCYLERYVVTCQPRGVILPLQIRCPTKKSLIFRSVLLGKILRLDVDTPNPDKPYSIPPDNPFLHEPDTLPEIYAYGFRSVWKCGKDRGDSETGTLCTMSTLYYSLTTRSR